MYPAFDASVGFEGSVMPRFTTIFLLIDKGGNGNRGIRIVSFPETQLAGRSIEMMDKGILPAIR